MYLSNFAGGRDNNFNLLRLLAAFSVLITHSFTLLSGSVNTEPLRSLLGLSSGSIAVDVFFVTSGFLVTSSLISRKSLIDFVWARFLRIFPGLWVMLVLTVLLLYLVSSYSLTEYFTNKTLYFYILKCSTLFFGVSHELPGVFLSNPYPRAINGSLWTMPNELRMYAILALFWSSIRIFKHTEYRLKLFKYITLSVTAIVAFILLNDLVNPGLLKTKRFLELFFMFFSGASYYLLSNKIKLDSYIFLCCVISLLVAFTFGKTLFYPVYKLLIPYIVFYLAYIPAGVIRKFNQFGDYSYGIYIYAFPIQQLLVYSLRDLNLIELTAFSGMATLLMAFFSWHLIEKPSLSFKTEFANKTRYLIKKYSTINFK